MRIAEQAWRHATEGVEVDGRATRLHETALGVTLAGLSPVWREGPIERELVHRAINNADPSQWFDAALTALAPGGLPGEIAAELCDRIAGGLDTRGLDLHHYVNVACDNFLVGMIDDVLPTIVERRLVPAAWRAATELGNLYPREARTWSLRAIDMWPDGWSMWHLCGGQALPLVLAAPDAWAGCLEKNAERPGFLVGEELISLATHLLGTEDEGIRRRVHGVLRGLRSAKLPWVPHGLHHWIRLADEAERILYHDGLTAG